MPPVPLNGEAISFLDLSCLDYDAVDLYLVRQRLGPKVRMTNANPAAETTAQGLPRRGCNAQATTVFDLAVFGHILIRNRAPGYSKTGARGQSLPIPIL
jgi:hypothetical protein